jgi:hypothetical protein
MTTMATSREPSPEDIREARSRAVDAELEAEELEAQARKARRIATARMKHYEDLLLISQGQMQLPLEEQK